MVRLDDRQTKFIRKDASRRLIVLLHGWMRSPADFEELSKRLNSPDADQYIPKLPIGLFSKAVPDSLVEALVDSVTLLWEQRRDSAQGPYDDIIIVGHSCGAVLARAVFAAAYGVQDDATIRRDIEGRRVSQREWAPKIRRIVMLAAVNRGYNPNSAMSAVLRVSSWFGDWLDRLPGERFFVFNLRRGAAFLTKVRLQSFAIMRDLAARRERPPIVCQLLGTVDDLVAPADNIDLATGQSFYYLETPKSGHFDIVDVTPGPEGDQRWAVFLEAFEGTEDQLQNSGIPLSDVTDIFDEAEDDHDVTVAGKGASHTFETVARVVFVVHGIRDYGFWTRKIAARVKRKAGRTCRAVTSTYGYFPMGPFLMLTERRKRVEWLMDQYVTARCLYPNANFSYIGHSNGTYLLASAIKACPAIKFDRVVFAGSVVRRDFNWLKFLPQSSGGHAADEATQIRRVVNYAATGDWVVALVPRFCQAWKRLDLGDAGHHGFSCSADGLRQIRYVPGSHSAALGEQHWDEIASFALGLGDPVDVGPDRVALLGGDGSLANRRQHRHGRAVALLAYATWLLVPLGVGIACLPAVWLLGSLESFGGPALMAWALLFTAYCWLLGRVLTRI